MIPVTTRNGLKFQNMFVFFSKPMIYWTIDILKKSKLFKKIYVTTDSSDIRKIAKKYGALVPFLRNSDLADDQTPTLPVIRDAIKRIAINNDLTIFAISSHFLGIIFS